MIYILYLFCSKQPTKTHAVQFWFSVIYLSLRTLAISMCAAAIHNESKRPLEVVRAVPYVAYCFEVKKVDVVQFFCCFNS